ncbi:histidine phosphatase family protein [Alphaproteobacteria bacterium]|nr:histidine phosphatase family protein [Alphaproteobacteria bacterium]MDC3176621.1 histidine phosphatase family protein [Alphaproteobacteria bacterium]
MIKPAKLFLIRHAPVSSRKGFFPEHDPDAVIKKIQLKKLANVIPDNSTWYVSPLKRTIQTAEALSKYISYSQKTEEKNLAEQNFGDWSGKKISDVWKILKKNHSKHNFSFISPEVSPPNGESYIQQCKRVSHWLKNLSILENENIVVIAHSGTIKAIFSHTLKIKPEFTIGIDINHLSLSIFEVLTKKDSKYKGGRYRLLALNREI